MEKKLEDAIKTIDKTIRKYELTTLEKRMDILRRAIKDYTFRILFVGGFNAGKSAMINAMLGIDILKEGQRPETAIACEILYDTKKYIEAISGDMRCSFDFRDIESIDKLKYDYFILHLNCDELKNYPGCILVDMPGFDSGIKEHNKAILRYAGKGSAYILVIDCEDGTIKKSSLSFMREIKNYDENIAVAITKTDLKPQDDIEQIQENITDRISSYFKDEVPVTATSKYDESVGRKMHHLIERFDREHIFYQQFAPELYEIGIRCIDAMEIYRKSLHYDTAKYQIEIERHKKAKKQLSDRLRQERQQLEQKFNDTAITNIVIKIKDALYAQEDALAASIRTGDKYFTMTVNNILRPVLLNETQQYANQNFDSFISEMAISLSDSDESLQDIGNNVLEKFQQTNNCLQEMMQNESIHNTFTMTIAVTLTTVINAIEPLLNVLVIFLPGILKMFLNWKQERELKDKVRNQIIPRILMQLQPEIENALRTVKKETLQQIEERINSMIDTEKEALERAKEAKFQMMGTYEEKVTDLQTDIDELRSVMRKIS